MKRGWLFLVAIIAIGSVAYLPTHLSLGSLPAFFRWLAIVALCWAPVAIVRSLIDGSHGQPGDTEGLEDLQDDIRALREDIEARFADVTLAIDDLAPRASLTDELDEDGR